jgi:hypothetical protein
MAMDYFIGFSQEDKIALLRGLTESSLTGQVIKVQTANGVATEFDSKDVNTELTYQRLCDSIANSPDYDANDPIQVACAGNARPGITRMNFGGC